MKDEGCSSSRSKEGREVHWPLLIGWAGSSLDTTDSILSELCKVQSCFLPRDGFLPSGVL